MWYWVRLSQAHILQLFYLILEHHIHLEYHAFVAKHNLPIANMKHTVLVSSPGGEMRIKLICLAISISIRGVDFPSNLILLDCKDVDIILGMDWLSKYDRVI
jgi:hypothetical protein